MPPRPVEERLTTPRSAGAAGLAFSLLFVTSLLLLRSHPDGSSSPEEIRDWYLGDHAGRVALIGLYLVPFAGIAFLWFIAVIRSWIGEREDRFYATAFLGSGLLFVAMVFVAAGAGGATLASVKYRQQPVPDADTVLFARSLAFVFLYVYAVRVAAVFMIVVSTIGRRHRILPGWLVVAGYAGALVLLVTVAYVELLLLVFPLWVAAISIVILRAGRAGRVPGEGEPVL